MSKILRSTPATLRSVTFLLTNFTSLCNMKLIVKEKLSKLSSRYPFQLLPFPAVLDSQCSLLLAENARADATNTFKMLM